MKRPCVFSPKIQNKKNHALLFIQYNFCAKLISIEKFEKLLYHVHYNYKKI